MVVILVPVAEGNGIQPWCDGIDASAIGDRAVECTFQAALQAQAIGDHQIRVHHVSYLSRRWGEVMRVRSGRHKDRDRAVSSAGDETLGKIAQDVGARDNVHRTPLLARCCLRRL